MIRILAQLDVVLDYNEKMKKGDRVAVDALKLTSQGLLFRVTHIWKKSQWFHSDWFAGVEEKQPTKKAKKRLKKIAKVLR